MPRRKREGHRDFESSDQAQRLLLTPDYPPAVKQQLLLLQRGGRAQRRWCLVCGRQGIHCGMWIPDDALRPVPDPAVRPLVYWLCSVHHGQVDDADLQRLLYGRG